MKLSINGERLNNYIDELGKTGMQKDGKRTRLVATDEDKDGRDLIVSWMKELDLEVKIDRIGNIYGIWANDNNRDKKPIMTGSHVDSVIDAGQYDGCLGIVAGLEVIRTLKENNFNPSLPMAVCVFTNEEGVRYQPDMMGSLVIAKGMDTDEALNTIGMDGTKLGEELKRIGYAGDEEPGFLIPEAFVELHIEQGPIMDKDGIQIGAVENLQGIHWQEVIIEGVANHAGTTPTYLRQDAGLAFSKINVFLRDLCNKSGKFKTLSTLGTCQFEPNAINQIPSKVTFTIDLRNPNKEELTRAKKSLDEYIEKLESEDNVKITRKVLVDFDPVIFDEKIVNLVTKYANERGFSNIRITSGAGQDSQMMARICPTAMIFVPSKDGISHNPKEFTSKEDCTNGCNVLLDVMKDLAS